MDYQISKHQQIKQRRKIYLVALVIIAVITFGFVKFKNLVSPTVKNSGITISVAESGAIEATVPASGLIIPEYEVSITAPINSKIETVFRNAGESVSTGESILQLTKESSLVIYEKLNEEQRVNRNKINQLALALEKDLDDLKTQYSIKQIRIRSLETALAHEQSLLNIGGSTEENVKQAHLNLSVAQLELKQIKNQINNQQAMMKADLKSLGYEINIREKDINQISDKLRKASISSPRGGVITWINDKVGAEIAEGAELVRIADLSSFKVEATISETYADEVKAGRTAIVRINNADLRGKIINVQPAVQNGTVKFSITLNDKNSELLRPNLKADVFVVTSYTGNTIRVKNGTAFNGSEEQKIFVMNGKNAEIRNLKFGERNSDYVEVLSGIKAGDRVITSDMQEYMHLKSIEVK
ncbi:efflux RND transporter periplasmic adaptor subunit [Paradesertivirga mongoliensis]|uniref:Efflux RND transporter periplasmic adaptor subunit n=1 Tax=Paradesertivirga mongoliensis TaxID=2100740 RepID=A0ABW4ZIE7_9SPHI|nr:HlyD family efflux transporter periplasmic adaptor subunit [Pedobacter mongoliensis]